MIVFRASIEEALRPKWTARSGARPESVPQQAIKEVQQKWPGAQIERFTFPTSPGQPYRLLVRTNEGRQLPVFSDSRTGEVLGVFEVRWLEWLVSLHHNLLMGGVGRKITGIFGTGLFLLSVSGIVMWFARKPDWKSALAIKRGASWKRVMFDLHRSSGLLANATLLVISFTAIWMAYPDALKSLLAARPPKAMKTASKAKKQKHKGTGEARPIEDYTTAALEAIPGGAIREVRFPAGGAGNVTVRLWLPGDLRPEGSNQVSLDAASAKLRSVDRAADWPLRRKLAESASPIHYAEWGGLFSRILWCLTGLVPPVLFVSGVLIWWGPTAARRRAARRAGAVLPEIGEPEIVGSKL